MSPAAAQFEKVSTCLTVPCRLSEKARWKELWPEHGDLSRLVRKLLRAEARKVARRSS